MGEVSLWSRRACGEVATDVAPGQMTGRAGRGQMTGRAGQGADSDPCRTDRVGSQGNIISPSNSRV